MQTYAHFRAITGHFLHLTGKNCGYCSYPRKCNAISVILKKKYANDYILIESRHFTYSSPLSQKIPAYGTLIFLLLPVTCYRHKMRGHSPAEVSKKNLV